MAAVEMLWKAYSDRLLRFIQGRVSDRNVAEDLLQDVFVRIHSRIETLRDDRKLDGWIYRIARNAIVDYYRTRKPREALPEDLAEEADPEGARREIADCLAPMIEQLPGPYRDVLMRSEIERFPHKAVAEEQGISLSAAKSRVLRGRQMLKETLLDCCRFEFDVRGRMMDYEQRYGCERC